MKKVIILLASVICACIVCSFAWDSFLQGNYLKEFSEQCGVDISSGEVVSDVDTHGGFHGDGERLTVVHFADGYYCFYDRHSESQNPYDETKFTNRYSMNVTVAVYDKETDTLYLLTCDT